jgi:hypothetical protein
MRGRFASADAGWNQFYVVAGHFSLRLFVGTACRDSNPWVSRVSIGQRRLFAIIFQERR